MAALIAAIGAVGAWFAANGQLRQARRDRQADYYRLVTPFLWVDLQPGLNGVSDPPRVEVYAAGQGAAFNVLVSLIPDGDMGAITAPPVYNVLAGSSASRTFTKPIREGWTGYLSLTFLDTLGRGHDARQQVNAAGNRPSTVNALRWTCDDGCVVHLPAPARSWVVRPWAWLRRGGDAVAT